MTRQNAWPFELYSRDVNDKLETRTGDLSLKRGWQYEIFAITERNISKNVTLILERVLYEK